jgi:hypothetical protein
MDALDAFIWVSQMLIVRTVPTENLCGASGGFSSLLDADTLASAPAIQSALCSIRAGAVGGGCVPRLEGWLPWWGRLTEPLIGPAMRLARFLPVELSFSALAAPFRRRAVSMRIISRGKRYGLSLLSSVRGGLPFWPRRWSLPGASFASILSGPFPGCACI